ncbi:MAG: hypothetical protein H0W64_06455 [Gammaproteobacteria bacterium]|nr:hypothetical protein [Gammaproteobacteria bacterium]
MWRFFVSPTLLLLVLMLHPLKAFSTASAHPVGGTELYDHYRYSILLYYGITVSDPLTRILQGEIHRWPEQIQSIELDYTLDEANFLRRLVKPLVSIVQFAGDFTVRGGANQPIIYELDPYFAFRWANWCWNDRVSTSLAVGEGISYVTSIPSLENKHHHHTKRLLNFLMLEATLASPLYPRFQGVIRIHHRSGAYGLYQAGNTGSNDIGLGLRYLF